MMEAVFITVLNMNFTASFVIAAILASRVLFHRAPRIISYALWSAAFIRLICPFAIPVNFGIRAPIPADIGMQASRRSMMPSVPCFPRQLPWSAQIPCRFISALHSFSGRSASS